jgi:mono/diheme cytochrome c family protein
MKNHHLALFKLLAIACLSASIAACGGGGGSSGSSGSSEGSTHTESSDDGESSGFATSTKAATNAVAGQALYAAYCSSCHGAGYSSAKNYASTLSAIARDKGGMGYLGASIQTAQANDIASYLSYGAGTSTASGALVANQTISFASPGSQTLGATPAALTASASSGLAVTITSSTPTVCSVNVATLGLLAVGTCTLTVSQLGNASYAAATPVSFSIAVAAAAGPTKTAQSIAFASPGNLMLASPAPVLVATATSKLSVSFASATPSVCAVSGVTLTLRRAGTCSVVANQPGDATYAGATTVSTSFYVVASGAAAGKTAYNQVIGGQSCAGCHGLPGSQPASLILSAANADVVLTSAIQNNVGGMGALQGRYTQQQILDITAYLATPGI